MPGAVDEPAAEANLAPEGDLGARLEDASGAPCPSCPLRLTVRFSTTPGPHRGRDPQRQPQPHRLAVEALVGARQVVRLIVGGGPQFVVARRQGGVVDPRDEMVAVLAGRQRLPDARARAADFDLAAAETGDRGR